MVIGEDVEGQLQPFHEYECTGHMDEHVIWIDETEEKNKAYNDPNETIPMIFRNGKMLFSKYDKRAEKFWHGDGIGISSRDEFFMPDGHEVRDVPKSQVYDSLEQYLRDWEGYSDENFNNGEVGRYTNPNAKWDWWVIGGRWSGFLNLRGGGRSDSAMKKDIDLDGMRNAKQTEAEDNYDKALRVLSGAGAPLDWISWEDMREIEASIDDARNKYKDQPSVAALRSVFDSPFFEVDQFLCDREDYIRQARDNAISTYAVVVDGKWHSKGEMGWFGFSNDDKEQSEWSAEINNMLDGLPDDTLITIVDCHI